MMEVCAERAESQYSVYVDHRRAGRMSWMLLGGTMVITQLDVEPAFRNLGIESLLTKRLSERARAEGRRVIALCPVARRWLRSHPECRTWARLPQQDESGVYRRLLDSVEPAASCAGRAERQVCGAAPRGESDVV